MMKYSQYSLEELKKEIPTFGYNHDDVIEYPEYISLSIKDLSNSPTDMFDEPMDGFDRGFFEMVLEDLDLFNHLLEYGEAYPYCDVKIESVDSVVQSYDKNYVYIHIILNTSLISTTNIPEHLT